MPQDEPVARSFSFRADAGEDPGVLEQQLRLLDGQAELPSVRRLRQWVLAAVDPRPGETAVDIGSGTGDQAQSLAALVSPGGQVLGVEPSAALRAEAERRAATGSSPGGARFIAGTAEHLPLDDATVDVVRCERVFQHLEDPALAAREIARVLRPSGRAVILDSDWGSTLLHPGDPHLIERLRRHWLAGSVNPGSGRRLPGLLMDAGLQVDPDIGSSAIVVTGAALLQWPGLSIGVKKAVSDGVLTAIDGEQLREDLTRAAEQGRAFFSVTMYAVVGRRI